MIKKVLFMIMLLFAMGIQAQEIITCSPEKTFWLITDSGKNYAVELHGDVKKSNHPKVITVDGKALQYLVVDKKEHAEKAGSTEDLRVLAVFVSGETAYLASQFKADMNIRMEMAKLSNGKQAIYWTYQMPAGTGDDVEMQHFLNVVEGDKIFGLASTQFKGDDAEEIKQMLIGALGKVTVVKDGKNICK